MIHFSAYESPLGKILLASDMNSLTGLWFQGQAHAPSLTSQPLSDTKSPVFRMTTCWLDLYFQGRDPGFLPPLSPHGTEFRELVWQLLLEIPYGETCSYQALAELAAARMNRPRMSAQAVGGAVGHNPISLIIPCHRVIGSDGSLTGYAGGLDRKQWLLDLESGRTVSPVCRSFSPLYTV